MASISSDLPMHVHPLLHQARNVELEHDPWRLLFPSTRRTLLSLAFRGPPRPHAWLSEFWPKAARRMKKAPGVAPSELILHWIGDKRPGGCHPRLLLHAALTQTGQSRMELVSVPSVLTSQVTIFLARLPWQRCVHSIVSLRNAVQRLSSVIHGRFGMRSC